MGLAIVSLLVLVIVGALAGLLLSRVFAGAATRNEDASGDNEDREEGQQADLSEGNKRSIQFFLGLAAAVLAILIDVGIVGTLIASAFFNYIIVTNSGLPIIFLALALGVVGYFLGVRKLGIGAIAFTVAVGALSVVITLMQEGG